MLAPIMDEALYAQKLSLFQNTAEDVLEILQGELGYNRFCEVFSGEIQKWVEDANSNPCAIFPTNSANQEVFFQTVEAACMHVGEIPHSDHLSFVCPPSPLTCTNGP
jgi:hypothetical protein